MWVLLLLFGLSALADEMHILHEVNGHHKAGFHDFEFGKTSYTGIRSNKLTAQIDELMDKPLRQKMMMHCTFIKNQLNALERNEHTLRFDLCDATVSNADIDTFKAQLEKILAPLRDETGEVSGNARGVQFEQDGHVHAHYYVMNPWFELNGHKYTLIRKELNVVVYTKHRNYTQSELQQFLGTRNTLFFLLSNLKDILRPPGLDTTDSSNAAKSKDEAKSRDEAKSKEDAKDKLSGNGSTKLGAIKLGATLISLVAFVAFLY